jgi:hypothetical protein
MTVRPKLLVRSHSIVEGTGSNSNEITNIRLVFFACIGELIIRSEESYRVCVCVCVCVCV